MPVLSEYVKAAMSQAKYKKLDNDTIYGEIAECPGVWANENTIEKCQDTLQEVLEEWIIMKLRDGDILPSLRGIDLTRMVAEA